MKSALARACSFRDMILTMSMLVPDAAVSAASVRTVISPGSMPAFTLRARGAGNGKTKRGSRGSAGRPRPGRLPRL